MNDYSTQRAWTDQLIPQIENILIDHFLEDKSLRRDLFSLKQSTPDEDYAGIDGVLLLKESTQIAFRLRDEKYLRYYSFTFRDVSKQGYKTEWTKLKTNNVRYYFYGWVRNKQEIIQAELLDMNKFRQLFMERWDNPIGFSCMEIHYQENDRSGYDQSKFYAFDIPLLKRYNLLFTEYIKYPPVPKNPSFMMVN